MDGYAESGPRTYTLTATEEKIDMSKKNLGSADVALVAAWLCGPPDISGFQHARQIATFARELSENKVALYVEDLDNVM